MGTVVQKHSPCPWLGTAQKTDPNSRAPCGLGRGRTPAAVTPPPQRSPASLQHTQLTDTDSLRAEPQAKCGELLQEAEEITAGGLTSPATASRAAFDLAGLGKSTFTKEGQLEVGRIPSAAPSSVVVH